MARGRGVAGAERAGLNVTAKARVTTPPGGTNPVAFWASASDHNVGLTFDNPLNRRVERSTYRASATGTLIGSWANYETDRIQLLLDTEVLQLDDRGIAIDEHHDQPADLFTLPAGFPDRLPGPRKGVPAP